MSSDAVNIVLELSADGQVLSFSVHKVVGSEDLTEIKSNSDVPESCPICTCRISVFTRRTIPKLKTEILSDNEDFPEESNDSFETKVETLVSSDDEKPIVELFLTDAKNTNKSKKIAPLRCLHCNTVFRNEQNWTYHKKRLGIEEPVGSVPVPGALKCPNHCKRFFANKEELLKHLKTAKSKTGTYKCEKCPEVFRVLSTYRRHLFKHGSVRCHKCNHKSKDNKAYNQHMETHVVARSHRCKICAAAHESEVTLALHMRFVHEDNQACSFCGKTFSKWQSLLMHENRHQNIFPYECKMCGASFSRQFTLNTHMDQAHLGVVYICDFCGVSVKRKDSLRNHILSRHVTQEKFLDCTHCSMRFDTSQELKSHQTIHDEKPFVELYLATLKEEPDAKKTTVHAFHSKKIAPLRCLHCNTVFRNKQNWNNHKKRLGIEEPVGSVPVPDALKCPNHCKRYFANKEEMLKHLKNAKRKTRSYKCEKCPEVFKNIRTWRRHLFKHGSVRCHKCNEKCKDNKAYTKHMETHVVARSHRCKICAAAHESEVTLAIHMRFIHEDNQACSFCGKTFSSWQSLLMHENRHQNIYPYVCEQCGASFSTQFSLNSHMDQEHLGVIYICDFCGLSVKRKDTLRNHILSRHVTQEKLFSCSQCPKRFGTTLELRRHQTIHGEMKFPCPTCGKRFPSMIACKKHIGSMHTDLNDRPKFECEHCGKIFLNKYSMKDHLKTHTDAAELQCRYCYKTLSHAQSLRRHEMMHTDERPYTCQTCGKAFRHSDGLKTHIRLHTGEKPYECPLEVCKKRFSDRGGFRGHLLNHEKQLNIKLIKKKNYLND